MSQYREIFHQTLSVLTVLLNEFCLGVGNGWTAPILSKLQTPNADLSLTIQEASWIASVEHIGKIFGALTSACLIDIIGRKKILAFCSFTFFAMWLAILLTRSVGIIYLVRIIYGIAFGLNDGVNTVYLGENSSLVTRGIFSTATINIYYIGLLFELVVASYFSYTTTSIINVSCTLLTFLGIFWMVEPVQFLLMKDRHAEAEANFLWLKGAKDISEVQSEFDKIKQNAYTENSKKSSIKKRLTSPANYKSVLISLTMNLLCGSVGYYPIMSYVSLSFSSTYTFTPGELTVLFGIAQFATGLTTSFIIERVNRRAIMLVSFAMISVLHGCTALLYYFQENVSQIPYFSWLIFATITLYASTYSFVFPVVFLIRGELFPLSIKAAGACISVMGYSLMSFLMTKIFLIVAASYGIYLNFVIFSVLSSTLVLFIYFVVPETRNKSLIEIQEILEKEN